MSGTDPPVENVRVPVCPSRSGRLPNVIAIVGAVPSGHTGSTSMANRPAVGRVVVGATVVVVGLTVVVVVGAAVVVVVPGFGGGQSPGDGSGWPTSSAMISERPWASLNSTPTAGVTPAGKAFSDTEIGFCPVCRRSPSPGVVSYLQTNHFGFGGGLSSSPVAFATLQAPSMPSARTAKIRRISRHPCISRGRSPPGRGTGESLALGDSTTYVC